MLPSGRELYDMTVSGRAKTQTGLYWVWGDDGIGDAKRPGSEHHGWGARNVLARGVPERRRLALRPSGNVAERDPGGEQKQQSCSASLGLAFMDDRLLARVFVIRKR